MAYGKRLTEAEYAGWRPNNAILRYVEFVRVQLGLTPTELRVLDWGCGRGNYVLNLRDRGYAAFGADTSSDAINRGRDFLERRGVRCDDVVRTIRPDGSVDLPANSFHLVFSNYVIEHVRDLDLFASAIRRMTAPGGFGFHVYPGRWRFLEGHLRMPIVHWLPKGAWRRALIRAWASIGVEAAGWTDGADLDAKTNTYFKFSVEETFYSSYSSIRDAFVRHGFLVTPHSLQLQYPRIAWLAQLSGQQSLARAFERLILDGKTGELFMQRI